MTTVNGQCEKGKETSAFYGDSTYDIRSPTVLERKLVQLSRVSISLCKECIILTNQSLAEAAF